MKPYTRRLSASLVGTTAILVVCGAAAGRGAWASTCFSPPAHPPTCIAQAGDKVCSGDSSRQCMVNADCVTPQTCVASGLNTIGVTVTPYPGQSISSVVITGSANLVTIPASPSGGVDQVVTFRVRQTTTTQDDLGTATVNQATNLATCTVDLAFDFRAVSGSTPQTICPLTGGYTLDIVDTLPSPAGTTVCASHLASCTESPNLPAGFDFLPGDSRVLSIFSPITGSGITMEIVRAGSFMSNLRMMYSRFAGSFPTYTDITYAVAPGAVASGAAPTAPTALTAIRGTGDWSSLKLVVAKALESGAAGSSVPTISEWGLIIMSLLLLTGSSIRLSRRRLALASGTSQAQGPALLAPGLLGKVSAGIGALGLLSLAIAVRAGWTPNATDVIGCVISAGILAYLLHYWIALSGRS